MYTFLHTNDFHGQLTETKAVCLQHKKEALGNNCLLLDTGDAVSSGNISFKLEGEPVHELMNRAGYDFAAPGNREFHILAQAMHCKLKLSSFPFLCSNIFLAGEDISYSSEENWLLGSRTSEIIHPAAISHTPSGKKIAILGLMVPMVTRRMSARYISDFHFDQPIAAASQLVPILRNKYMPDILIVLSHIGFTQDRKLAETVPGIDLIIGGHSHTILDHGDRVGDTLIVQTGSHGKKLGRVVWQDEENPSHQRLLTSSLEDIC